MGPLTVISNVTSNLPPRYHDDPAEDENSRTVTPTNDAVHLASSDEPLLDLDDDGSAKGYIPPWMRRTGAAVVKWCKGPVPPRPWSIKPFFPDIQEAPIRLLDQYLPKPIQRFWLLMFFYLCWVVIFVTVLNKSAFTSEIRGYDPPEHIGCGQSFWADKNGCGLNGNACRPFHNRTLSFRCPGSCRKTHLLNPHAVGAQELVYQPLVVGGPSDGGDGLEDKIYRGDSFICAAAIHAGFISNAEGGCGVAEVIGEHSNFASSRNAGINSAAFDSDFPLSYRFIPGTRVSCQDLRVPITIVTIVFSAILSLFTTSPAVFFGSLFCGMFFNVALVSDPPTLFNYYALISSALGRFLPAAFVMFVIYKYCIEPTLRGLTAQVEKTILWLGACWVGCLNNYTFDKIPIQRLTPHDLHAQPGAIPALIIIVLCIFGIALGQAWAIRIAGKMPQYLALYGFMVFCLLMLVAVPHMNVRIHHYILGLLLVPGTAMQNRPSLLYQGLLIGFFINGIARWGFDSILQTPDELRGDGAIGSILPNITAPIITVANITFMWADIPERYDGISILVNDVERFRGYEGSSPNSFTWEQPEGHLPQYFRFGYMDGNTAEDYTKAGIWNTDGTWTQMQDGPSLIVKP